MQRISRVFSALLLMLMLASALPRHSYAAEVDDVLALANGLQDFSLTLNQLGDLDGLAAALPLTSLSPIDPSALNLSSIFSDSLKLALDNLPLDAAYQDLADAITNASGTYGGITVTFSNVSVGPSSGALVDVNFSVTLQHTLNAPFALNQDDITLENGSFTLGLQLFSSFHFRLDTSNPNSSLAFYLANVPAFQLSVNANAAIGAFVAQLGFTDVSVDGSATLNTRFDLTMVDPDGNGRITRDEWSSTAIGDLINLSVVDQPGNDVAATLNIDTTLISGSPDKTLTFADASLADGFNLPTLDFGSLIDFTSVSPTDVLNGLSQLVASLMNLESLASPDLPFLQGKLSDVLDLAGPLIDFVHQQGDAALVCGTSDTDPPQGAVAALPAGATVYCQAVSLTNASSATWTIGNGTLNSSGPFTDTVGTNPNRNVQFTLTSPGRPQVEVTYVDVNGASHTVQQRFETAQELLDKLIDLAGLSGSVAYDVDTTALTYHLTKSFDAPTKTLQLNFGDQLRTATNLIGLSPSSGASASIYPSQLTLDLTFGVLLDPDVSHIPGGTTADRFFIKVRSGAGEYELSANTSVSANVALEGRLGFLKIKAVGDAGANSSDNAAFVVAPANAGAPMLGVNIVPPVGGIQLVNRPAVTDAVQVRQLLQNPSTYLDADVNIRMSGGISVTTSIGSPPVTLAGGRVGISWPDITSGRPAVTADAAFNQNLKVLDLNPGTSGKHSGSSNAATLTDGSKNFTQIAGLEGAKLRNVTDGSSCTIVSLTNTTLVCQLTGGAENDWDTNDEYSVDGNPLALLNVILDNLETIADLIDSLTGGDAATSALTKPLPIIGISPKDLLAQFRNLKSAIQQIRQGQSAAQILCGTKDTNPPSGDISALNDGTVIYCQARTNQRKVLDGEWTITGGTALSRNAATSQPFMLRPASVIPTADHQAYLPLVTRPGSAPLDNDNSVLATIGKNPTANAAFVINTGRPNAKAYAGSDFNVHLRFSGSGGTHVASLQGIDGLPTSLQDLEVLIEDTLGLPASAFGLELADLPAPGSTSGDGTKDLVVRLGYGICTQSNPDCTASSQVVTPTQVPINIDLGTSNPDLIGVSSNSMLNVDYAANAQLDLAIPLRPKFDANSIVVVDTTGVILSAGVSSVDLNLDANIGPLTIALGTSVDTDSGTAGVQPGAGAAKIGAKFTLNNSTSDSTPNNQTFTFSQYISGLSADLGGPTNPNDCGPITSGDYGSTTLPISLTGDACVHLAMGLNNTYLGDLGMVAPDLAAPSNWQVYLPADLLDQIANSLLDWDLLLQSLPKLLTKLQVLLEGGAANTSLPLLGDALDAGADIVETLNTYVVTPLANLGAQLKAVADQDSDGDVDPLDLQLLAQTKLYEALGPGSSAKLLLSSSWGSDGSAVDLDDVRVIATCGSAPCADGDQLTSISDLRVTFAVGQGLAPAGVPSQGCSTSDCLDGLTVPFNIGLPGLPLRSEGAIAINAGWRLLLDFGLSRNEGPYLVAGGTDHDAPELQIGASAALGENQAACDPINDPVSSAPNELLNYSPNRCLLGELGFLEVNIRDGADDNGSTASTDDDRTKLTLLGTTNLTSSSGDRLTIPQLLNGSGGLDFGLQADANVDLRVRTGFRDQSAGFPSILGSFHLNWSWGVGDVPSQTTPTNIDFKNLYLDLGSFISKYLTPIVREIKKVTGPLQPVIDTLRAPLPVLSDLSHLVGGDDISLMSLIQAVSSNDLTLINRLIQLISFINNLPSGNTNVMIPLSTVAEAFKVNKQLAKGGPLTPDRAGDLVSDPQPRTDLLNDIEGNTLRPDLPRIDGVANVTATHGAFGVDGLSFPFLDSATEIFGVLMGKDVTLIRYDAGTLRAAAGLSYTFGPIFVGPIPISIGLAGSVEVRGRFAIGYDTSGLRKVLQNGSSGVHLFDGIFIDDLDANGVDVPEISLIGTVSASAALDAVIVAAGVEGGIRLTVDLNLNDSPDPDGKLRIEEIFDKLQNPICLFDVSGRLEAFLNAFVRVGFSFFSKTFRIKIANVVLLDFSHSCSPPQPDLATVQNGNLVLNMGSQARRDARHILTDEINESFVVRQLNAEGTKFSISAFGAYEEETISAGGKIIANADDGDDSISLEAGVDPDGNTIPFTARAEFNGGDGNDSFKTGAGADLLNGGAGSDSLNGGGGNDTINGDADDDVLSGEIGDDTLSGGDGNDVILGGAGADTLNGNAGDDSLNGGPGSNTPTSPGNNPDLGDTIIGGTGNDDIDGGFGDDTLYGDEVLACTDEGAASGGNDTITGGFDNDTIIGGAGDDTLVGEDGDDTICGNSGADTIDGDAPANGATNGVFRISAKKQRGTAITASDGNDRLFGGSGPDTIHGRGGDDDIFGLGGADSLFGDGDNDDISGGSGSDSIDGGTGRDYLLGDDGTVNRPAGQLDATSVSVSETSGDADTIHGRDGSDVIFGEGGADQLFGDAGADTISGNGGDDTLRGGDDADTLSGNADADTLFGDSGNDRMFGNAGADTLRGGLDDDYLEGNEDADTLFGDAGQDDLIGGSSAPGTPDAADVINGNAGHDVLAGDNATITRPGGTEVDGSTRRSVTLLDPTIGGGDTLHGDEDNDRIFGGPEKDTIYGDDGDDYAEGNQSNDTLYGGLGQDDLIGGSSTSGAADGRDIITGNDDHDVLAGDNATIVRTGAVNTFDGSQTRVITLLDPTIGGPDTLYGNFGNDRLYGGPANDDLHGHAGDDYLEGNQDADLLIGYAGQDDLIGGSSTSGAADGADELWGGDHLGLLNDDADVLAGDNAAISRPLSGGQWISDALAPGVSVIRRSTTLYDVATTTFAPDPSTSAADQLFGENGFDVLYGQGADDLIHAGPGDDYAEGNAGADRIYGDSGQDDLIGGSGRSTSADPASAVDGRLDGSDLIFGGSNSADLPSDFDVIAGDNATILRPLSGGAWIFDNFAPEASNVIRRSITLYDVATASAPAAPGTNAADELYGEGSHDVVYGQGGDETISGGSGDDYIEGNDGNDTIFGNADQDDLIGGSGRVISDDPSSAVDGRRDGADTIYGADHASDLPNDFDVIAGDNATILRPLSGGHWQVNTFNASYMRTLFLYDVGTADQPAASGTSGGDTLFGEGSADLMYGQGADDLMSGGSGDDYMEGNAASDTMNGDADNDDMVGGTGRINTDGPSGSDGRLDANDTIHGNAGFDVIAGDNAVIARTLVDGQWQSNIFNDGIQHERRILRDLDSAAGPLVSGGDSLYGDADDDLMYGQGADDTMSGGSGDDFMEGNHGSDTMDGNAGQDDMLGGTTQAGLTDGRDLMHGNADADIMLGDNGSIERPLDSASHWQRQTFAADAVDIVKRSITLYDIASANGNQPSTSLSGGDTMFGDAGRDQLFGQGNGAQPADQADPADGIDNDLDGQVDEDAAWLGDELHGGSEDDYMEGNHGQDLLFGDDGQDDMIGGYSSGNGVIGSAVKPSNMADGADIMHGGNDGDVMLGDSASITRPLDAKGRWQRIVGGTLAFDLVVRETDMVTTPQQNGAFGDDYMQGNDGHDDMYGQRGNDYMEGNTGEDAMLGDLGKITNRLENGSREEVIETNAPFLSATIFAEGTLTRLVEQYAFDKPVASGDDIMLGGDGHDSVHGGPGADIINGDGGLNLPATVDNDVVFGGDDNDVVWGGRDSDWIWGGYGDDNLDVKPRPGRDPQSWFTYGSVDNYQGFDTIYGGWDQDALQADVGGPGPVPGDRLLDWVGAYNVYYTCPGAYGEGVITRGHSPSVIRFVQDLAEGAGVIDASNQHASGYNEVAMVFPRDARHNSHPAHPDNPGHFTCN